jgi:hypothetical protein
MGGNVSRAAPVMDRTDAEVGDEAALFTPQEIAAFFGGIGLVLFALLLTSDGGPAGCRTQTSRAETRP